MKIETRYDHRTLLGEGPVWDVKEQALYWIDVEGRQIVRGAPDGRSVELWDVPQPVGAMALREQGGAILALADGFYVFDFDSGHCECIQRVERASETVRLNDGKVDPAGRFVAGSMDTTEEAPLGVLYSIGSDLAIQSIERNVVVSNGPCWSADGTIFYFSDSRARTIRSYAYDAGTGRISKRKDFGSFGPHDGLPDGATVDAEGFVWSVGVYAGKLHRFAPDGKLNRTIELPVRCATSVAFGGPDLSTLFVTSMSRPPVTDVVETSVDAGRELAITGLGVAGLPQRRFAG